MKEIDNAERQEAGRWLNDRLRTHTNRSTTSGLSENEHLQKFAAVRRAAHNHFNQERLSAETSTENTLSRTG